MSKKPTVLMILDGYGLNDKCEHNAVCEAKTPIMDQLMSQCPYVKGQASGLAVGLPDGQMGNSEVGHLNMGAGRVVYQELTRITKSINDGDFFNVPEFLTAVENCKKNNSALHLFGLVSTGGVHSHLNHIYGLLELAKRNGLEKVYVHCFLDGRDTPPESGKEFVTELEAKMAELGTGKVAAVKSGPSVFNADSKKRQEQNFTAASKLAQQAKARYEAYIGYCYGKKKESGRGKPKMYQELAGKRFWTELTGDEDFYIKIIGYMGTMPEKYVADYKESYNRAANRLVREFSNSFCREDGSIDWEKLVEFNSGD